MPFILDKEEITDSETFRDELSTQFATHFRKKIKQGDIESENTNHTFLLDINNELIENKVPLSEVLEHCNTFQINHYQKGAEHVSACIQTLIDTIYQAQYQVYLDEDEQTLKKTGRDNIAEVTPVSELSALAQQLAMLASAAPKDDLVQTIQAYFHQQNPDYHGAFIDLSDINSLIAPQALRLASQSLDRLLEEHKKVIAGVIDQFIDNSPSPSLQLIVRLTEHYIALDINTQLQSLAILDAAGDFRKKIFQEIASYSKHMNHILDMKGVEIPSQNIQNVKALGHIQKDKASCALYALSLSREAALIPDFHEALIARSTPSNTNPHLHQVTWFQLPPCMVKLSQSTSLLEAYLSNNPKTRAELMSLTNNNERGHGLATFTSEVKTVIEAAIQANCTDEPKDTQTRVLGLGDGL